MQTNDTTILFNHDTIVNVIDYLQSHDYEIFTSNKSTKLVKTDYNLDMFSHDYKQFCFDEFGQFMTIHNKQQIEDDNQLLDFINRFIKKLVKESRLLSAGITMSKRFFHEHLEKFLKFNNCQYIEQSCSQGSKDIVYTQFVKVYVVLSRRVPLETVLDYIKFSDKYDNEIARKRNIKYNIRAQQDY